MVRRFRVACWVTFNNERTHATNEGFETFQHIWNHAPSAARWAIAECEDGVYSALDLRDIAFDQTLVPVLVAEHRQPTLEAATACAMMIGNPSPETMALLGWPARKSRLNVAQLLRSFFFSRSRNSPPR